MKKFRLFAALLVVALCVGFSSCGGNSLVGTTWVGVEDDWTITLTFTNEEFGIFAESWQDGGSRSNRFYSTFNNPNITIRAVSQGGGSLGTYRGVVRRRVMTLTCVDYHYTIVFNRR